MTESGLLPTGFQVKSAFGDLPPDWKDRVPYTLDSQQRFSYRTPKQQREHLLTVNRYGCNRNKRIPAAGASEWQLLLTWCRRQECVEGCG